MTCVFSTPTWAQATSPTGADIAAEAISREMALHHVREVERLAGWIAYVESVALVSEYGAWPNEKNEWPEDGASSFAYDVSNLRGRLEPVVVDLRHGACRAHVFGDDEAERFEALLYALSQMIAESGALYDLIKAGQTAEANAFYKERVRASYRGITGDAHTLISEIESDLRGLRLDLLRLR